MTNPSACCYINQHDGTRHAIGCINHPMNKDKFTHNHYDGDECGEYCPGNPVNQHIDLKRKDWRHYFMDIAHLVGSRATCDRKHVGAVIVRNNTLLSSGYNGAPRRMVHCDDVGHMMENDHCVRTVHAEANAIVQAAKNGVMIDGGTIYTTASPCWPCFQLIVNSGLVEIVFGELYRDPRISQFSREAGIKLYDMSE